MSREADDTSWLDIEIEPPVIAPELASGATAAAASDDWLHIGDPNKGKTNLAFRDLIDACMRGTNRVMAHNGKWLAYRPFNREFDKETNPRTIERMSMHQANGWIKHVGTYDEVQVWEFNPIGFDGKPNPYYHEGGKEYIVGTSYFGDIRQAAKLACERKWPEYHDFLEGMAIALKRGRDPSFARTMWADALNQVAVAIKQIGGNAAPSELEINRGFSDVRQGRGISKGGVIAVLNSDSLQKVGFR